MEVKKVNNEAYLQRLKMFKEMKKACEYFLGKCELEKVEFWKKEIEIMDEKIKTYELCFNDLFGGFNSE